MAQNLAKNFIDLSGRQLILVLVGVFLAIVGVGLYFARTSDINTAKGTVNISSLECYVKNGIFSRSYYMKYKLIPTRLTQPDRVYEVVVGNGVVGRTNRVLWTSLEKEINKLKAIDHRISYDEFIALNKQPNYRLSVKEIRSEHNPNYLMWPLVYFLGVTLAKLVGVDVIGKSEKKERPNYIRPFRNKLY